MKTFFDQYIDMFTLALAAIISIVLAIKTWNESERRTRLGILSLFFFAPVLIASCMFTHLLEVTYHAIDTRLTGAFAYSFHLYSLYLMPLVIGYLSLKYYEQSRLFCLSGKKNKNLLLKSVALIALVTLPAVKFTPIAALPSMVSMISLTASFFIHKGVVAAALHQTPTVKLH
jgi:hypothetical protein